MTDYLAMSDYDAIRSCGCDATKWSAWFCQCAKLRGEDADEDLMTTWFANAMMAMHDFKPSPIIVVPQQWTAEEIARFQRQVSPVTIAHNRIDR